MNNYEEEDVVLETNPYHDLPQEEILNKLQDVYLEKRFLENDEEKLKNALLNRMIDDNIDKLSTPIATFSKATRTSWKYNKEVLSLEETIKKLKKVHQDKGYATPINTDYITIKIK